MSKTYRIGQIFVFKSPQRIERAISGEHVDIPKGTRCIIGGDRLAHHFGSGLMQPLAQDATVEGISPEGLAEWIYHYMRNEWPLEEMLDNYGETAKSFKSAIVDALGEMGI